MTTPSDRVYGPFTRRSLERAEFKLAYSHDLRELLESYLRRHATPQMLAGLRAEVSAKVERVMREELGGDYDRVKWYLMFDPERYGAKVKMGLYVPLYLHDCDACRYLGRFTATTFRGEETWDLWTCDKAGWRTFICRYGDDGPDYTSYPEFVVSQIQGPHPALFECVRRWKMEAWGS